MKRKVIIINNPVTKEGKIKPIPGNLRKAKPVSKGGKEVYKHRAVTYSPSRMHVGQRPAGKVLLNKRKPKKLKNKLNKGVYSMTTANRRRGKKKTYHNKKRVTPNPVNKRRGGKKYHRNPSFENSFTMSGIVETAVDGLMVAGSGIILKKIPDWIRGWWDAQGVMRYVVILAGTFGIGFLANAFGQKRVAKNVVMGGITALSIEALQQIFPTIFGTPWQLKKLQQQGSQQQLAQQQMSKLVVAPTGQVLLKGDDGEYYDLSADLTPEELAQQQSSLAQVMADAGATGIVDRGAGVAGDLEVTDGDTELVGDDYEYVEGDEEDLDGLNDFAYRKRINEFSYR